MEWTKGQKIHHDKYTIDEVLGRGGFGISYKAIHTGLNNSVVIKVPIERFASYFDAEIKILATLSKHFHPHIIRARDQFYEDQTPCLVMDFVEGDTLFDFLQKRQSALFEVEAVKLISQIGEALAFMHEIGLVHRDVNPKNIICQPDGRAVLIDFGTARRIATNSDDTPSNNALICARPQTSDQQHKQYSEFFAPSEQIFSESDGESDCLPTVDIYSLAATLYYLVTGECPEPARERAKLNTLLKEPKKYAEISNRLNDAILCGMELKAENRPKSMCEWLNLLTLELDNSPSLFLDPDINYPLLEDLLSKKEWGKADQQTSDLILKIANRENQGWLGDKDWQDFPCSELQKIDNLWRAYSQKHFGFNVQRDIWKSEVDWVRFAEKIGWLSSKPSLMQRCINLFRKQEQLQEGKFPTIAKPSTGILLGLHPDKFSHRKSIIDLQDDTITCMDNLKQEEDALRQLERHLSQARIKLEHWTLVDNIVQDSNITLSRKILTGMNQHSELVSELEDKIQEQSKVCDYYQSKLLDLGVKVNRLKSVRELAIELLILKLDCCDREI
jgi:eukaryotic-like serine/threonine-protein kinase